MNWATPGMAASCICRFIVDLNGKPFGRADAGVDMTFDFGQLIAHAAKTRPLCIGHDHRFGHRLQQARPWSRTNRSPKVAPATPASPSCAPSRPSLSGAPETHVPALRRHRAHRDEGQGGPFDLRCDRAVGRALRKGLIVGSARDEDSQHGRDRSLFDYWRSSASYRVRIALEQCSARPYRFGAGGPACRGPSGKRNISTAIRRGSCPCSTSMASVFTQSLAIIEYLAETRRSSQLPGLIDAVGRQRVRALSYAIAMDIHPVCNLGVVSLTSWQQCCRRRGRAPRLDAQVHRRGLGGVRAPARPARHTGELLPRRSAPAMADFCLVPQVYNARRWDVDLSACPKLVAIDQRCAEIDAFARAHPDRTPR